MTPDLDPRRPRRLSVTSIAPAERRSGSRAWLAGIAILALAALVLSL